ncbi:MAG: class I SAM-dependent methyltransferase [Gammaproteobacteria bacterium]|nr:class I SAM-dependent methyltransferase [Gammaproteobacteria bacterium]
MDTSYEEFASEFVAIRDPNTGVAEVRQWSDAMGVGDTFLDLGCGHGLPLGVLFRNRGLKLYAIDNSPSLLDEYKHHIPEAVTACESAVDSDLFLEQFDGVLVWGLIFLLEQADQITVLDRISSRLKPGGHLLFTAPWQQCQWQDLLTGRECLSLGSVSYHKILRQNKINVRGGFLDQGENYYYDVVKLPIAKC